MEELAASNAQLELVVDNRYEFVRVLREVRAALKLSQASSTASADKVATLKAALVLLAGPAQGGGEGSARSASEIGLIGDILGHLQRRKHHEQQRG